MVRLPVVFAAAVAVLGASAVSLVIGHAWLDSTVPEGRSLWRGHIACQTGAYAGAATTLVILRSGNALAGTMLYQPPPSSSSGGAGVLLLRGAVDVTGHIGLAPDRWLVRAPDAPVAPSFSGRGLHSGDADLVLDVVGTPAADVCRALSLSLADERAADFITSLLPRGDSTWLGSYTCLQGETSLQLDLHRDGDDTLDGTFSFGPGPETPAIPTGSFHMQGAVDGVTGRVWLAPTDWIDRPPHYVTVGLRGILANGALGGDVRMTPIGAYGSAPDGCSGFQVARPRG